MYYKMCTIIGKCEFTAKNENYSNLHRYHSMIIKNIPSLLHSKRNVLRKSYTLHSAAVIETFTFGILIMSSGEVPFIFTKKGLKTSGKKPFAF